MDTIAVITYNHYHRKTQDVVFGLKANGYQNVILIALPFIKRTNSFRPIYIHRPVKAYAIPPKLLAKNYGYQYLEAEPDEIVNHLKNIQPNTTLIAGAGILPANLVQKFCIVNSHPAYLPEVRGLDALKWAIHYQKKIGVTTHIINEHADAGWLIERKIIPVYANDTFHSLAFRQYRTEIELLIESVQKVKNKDLLEPIPEIGETHKRMPKSIEQSLMQSFEDYKAQFAIQF